MEIQTSNRGETIFFPCVGVPAHGQLLLVNCFVAQNQRSTIKVLGSVSHDVAKRIVDASRHSEEPDDTRNLSVAASIPGPSFSGMSYNLALALADKLARRGSYHSWSYVYATGVIPTDRTGEVHPVEVKEFEAKFEILLEHAKSNSIFIFPKENLDNCNFAVDEKKALLEKKGIVCKEISHLNELEGVLWKTVVPEIEEQTAQRPVENLRNKVGQLLSHKNPQYAFLVFGIVILSLLFFISKDKNSFDSPKSPQTSVEKNKGNEEKSHQGNKEEVTATVTLKENPKEAPALAEDKTKQQKENIKQKVIASPPNDTSIY